MILKSLCRLLWRIQTLFLNVYNLQYKGKVLPINNKVKVSLVIKIYKRILKMRSYCPTQELRAETK